MARTTGSRLLLSLSKATLTPLAMAQSQPPLDVVNTPPHADSAPSAPYSIPFQLRPGTGLRIQAPPDALGRVGCRTKKSMSPV